MRRSIFWKFVAAYLLFALIGFCTINFTTTNQTYEHLLTTNASSLHKGTDSISGSLSDLNSTEDIDSRKIVAFNSTIINISKSLDAVIWVIDDKGNILHTTGADSTLKSIPDFDISYFGKKYYKTGTFFKQFDSQVLSVYSPIVVNDNVGGYVLAHMATTKILYSTIKIVDIFYVSYFIILFFSMLIFFTFILNFYLPMKSIRRATLEYANGNFAYDKLKIHTNDEMGDLASSLVYMAHQLNDAEEYQKKFVANISHDFRSPLTSIKGYVEAIIDGTIPPELQNKYLKIVLSEAERLEKLTNGLITLNTWGGKKTGLIIENFNIDDIIISTLETFEGTADKKGIRLCFEPGNDHNVKADKGKIQQVLYNLIDNAIKFSHHDSEITIKVYVKGDKIFCSVKDTGLGISKNDINKIWDRFYKTDSSRGKDKTGSGIGLAIVREIINAHNQNIDVISTEGVGTEFIFSLERVKTKKHTSSNNT